MAMTFIATLASVLVASVGALKVHHAGRTNIANSTRSNGQAMDVEHVTFQSYYSSYTTGRGIWKWNNALDAYQRHFATLAGKPVAVAEVGVQSGGSLLMWKSVLGQQIKLYGLDINPACKQFQEANVKITIGDQGDWAMWQGFFTKVDTGLNVIVDDGSHQAPHMLTTLFASFQHILPGGYIVIEDIVGRHYLESFFKPAATFLAQRALVEAVHSVHLYPLVLVVRKTGGTPTDTLNYPQSKINVGDFTGMWTAISSAPPGSAIVLKNSAWGSFFTADSLTNFFSSFIDLHVGDFKDTPTGCSTTAAAVCTNEITPLTHLQSRVSGVHIYNDHAIIEVAAVPPRIAATRKGTEWIAYSR